MLMGFPVVIPLMRLSKFGAVCCEPSNLLNGRGGVTVKPVWLWPSLYVSLGSVHFVGSPALRGRHVFKAGGLCSRQCLDLCETFSGFTEFPALGEFPSPDHPLWR